MNNQKISKEQIKKIIFTATGAYSTANKNKMPIELWLECREILRKNKTVVLSYSDLLSRIRIQNRSL